MRSFLSVLFCFVLVSLAFAIDPSEDFDDPALQARYEKIIDEVRCLKCQNQTIKDSNAFLAGDLRREIRRMLTEGKTDEQIFDFLVLRYGEFALYRPRSRMMWILPVVFLLVGGLIAVRVVRKRSSLPVDDNADMAEG